MGYMDLGANHGWTAEIASLMGWWENAGFDVLVDETPRDWLVRAETPVARPVAAAVPQPVAASVSAAPVPAVATRPEAPARAADPGFPDTLAAFQSWLATSDAISMPLSARVAASGDPASGLMVLVDLPEDEDPASGRLLSGAAGDLFDKMLAAMGRDRQSLYLSAMAPGRPSGGFVDRAQGALFAQLTRHHVALAKPRALLLMGEQPSRIFLNLGFVEARGRIHDVLLPGGAVSAVATFHPRTLLQHPQQKRRAWDDLQLLMKHLG
jgi:uracil-DNA glycosylase family 4